MTISKAQIGLEYMIMFALSLIIAGLLWIYASSDINNTRWDLQVAYAEDAVSRITDVAEIVHIQGEPAQLLINPTFPDNIVNAFIVGNTVVLELHWKNSIRVNVSKQSSVNLTGSINPSSGTHSILVRATNGNVEIIDQ